MPTEYDFDNPACVVRPCFKADIIMPNGKVCGFYAIADSEDEAREKIISLWKTERAKWKRITGGCAASRDDHVERIAGTASRNLGKIWVINRATKERKRVEASEVDALVANGWVKGGPRTKI